MLQIVRRFTRTALKVHAHARAVILRRSPRRSTKDPRLHFHAFGWASVPCMTALKIAPDEHGTLREPHRKFPQGTQEVSPGVKRSATLGQHTTCMPVPQGRKNLGHFHASGWMPIPCTTGVCVFMRSGAAPRPTLRPVPLAPHFSAKFFHSFCRLIHPNGAH
jgi:hypothetical protein